MNVIKEYNDNDVWNFDSMKKLSYSDKDAFAKIRINNIVIQNTFAERGEAKRLYDRQYFVNHISKYVSVNA